MYEIWLRNRGFNPVAILYPLETGVQPIAIKWTRCWQDAGSFEITLPASTPYLSDLMTLGEYIEIRNADTGDFEALYIIEHAELQTGIVNYVLDTSEHTNAVYAAGQGTGMLRDCVVRVDIDSVDQIGRLEGFADARDVEKDQFDLLRQRADAELGKIKASGTLVAKAGQPVQDETVTISGRSLLFYCSKRIILPPPATEAADIVDITGAEYDENTDSPDEVMKGYVENHLIAPADPARAVGNFVNQAALPPLADITYQGRFQTVLEALQEIAVLNNCGMEVVLNAANQFEFQVLRQVDHTIDGGDPIVFRSMEELLSVPGREYRTNWDIGDLVTLELGGLESTVDLTILAVTVELRPGVAEMINIAFDTLTSDDIERFRRMLLEARGVNIKAARA